MERSNLFDSDKPMTICGVRGRLTHRTTKPGGDDSALWIEVRGWRRGGGDIVGAVGETAQGYGVYLQNPHAMHLQDFEPGVGTIGQARAAALRWADGLGDHLGCKVATWGFQRDEVTPPASTPLPIGALCDAAATLWEAALDLRGRVIRGDPVALKLHSKWNDEGTAAIRQMVSGYAVECESAWHALTEEQQDDAAPFDWEFVPRWLRRKLESVL